MNKKSQDMLLLESYFADLKNHNNTSAALAGIKRVISRNFDITLNVDIVKNDTNKFFGMSIMPEADLMKQMIDSIIAQESKIQTTVKLWNSCKVWNLEIDSLILYDNNLNANPAELVAVLLHEIGHIIYSNSIPQKIHKITRYHLSSSSIAVKELIKWEKVHKLLYIVFIDACTSKNFNYINANHERVADKFVVKMGYGDALNQFINKLIASHGNSMIAKTDALIEKEIKSSINWTFINIAELQFRKKKLRQSLQTELLKNPSLLVRKFIQEIKSDFFGGDEAVYEGSQYGAAYEGLRYEMAFDTKYNRIVKEAFNSIFDKQGRVKKINQNDIDIVEIEIGRIVNEDDKIYVLDLIYDKLEIVNAALDFIEASKKEKVYHSKETLNNFKKQLEHLRKTVIEKDITPTEYKIFMKYPKGYEG